MSVILVLLISPLHLCSLTLCFHSKSFSGQLCELLSPALHVHERLVRAARVSSEPNNNPYSASRLVLVLVLSPLLCLGFVIAAWTAACFWVFAMILGNPEPSAVDREKDDGCAAVLAVGNWWVKWLHSAYRHS